MTQPSSIPPIETPEEQEGGARRGFALAGALLALVVVGALVTGSFYAASQEHSSGVAAKFNDDALNVAESAMDQALGKYKPTYLATLTGTTLLDISPVTIMANGQQLGQANVWVRPMGTYYLFISRGVASRGGSLGGGTRVIGVATKSLTLKFPQDRAMQIYDGLDVQGSALISGKDTRPSGMGAQWDTCTVGGTSNAIVARDTSAVNVQKATSIVGPITQDTSLNANSFLNYGGFTFDDLKKMADKQYLNGYLPGTSILPDTLSNGACDKPRMDNWGEPYNSFMPCVNYFPLIYIDRSVQLSAHGRGQGILLVDGDLDITGGFEFWGVTIVKGAIRTYGTGGHLNGTVMAFNNGSLSYDPNLAIGNSVVQLSTCAVRRAVSNLSAANRPVPVRNHSWMDLTAAGAGF